MAEDSDVRVGVAPLVERVDEDGRPGREIPADDNATRLLKVRLQPGKECGEGAAVEDALAPEPIDAEGQRREVAVEHAQRAGLKLTQHGSSGRLDPWRARLQLFDAGTREGEVNRNVERL